ncbi:MAG: hypothetical protein WAM66_14425 [Acidobacteriaceae bacterium]
MTYPETAAERDRWILSRRPPRSLLNPREPVAFFTEDERSSDGNIVPVAAIFLVNAECPFHCVMCDLWHNTLTAATQSGAVPEQIDFALKRLSRARAVKLYNSGSFFDSRALPVEDYADVAARVSGFDRVIVECHPAFVGERCVKFRDMLPGKLEVAVGLETAHPDVLEKLNKRMTLEQFGAAAAFLRDNAIDLRVFILVQPPFMDVREALYWAQRSLDFAFDHGATAATLIPTRGGNGAMETLAASGDFTPPALRMLEAAMDYGLRLERGRVFADLWDLEQSGERACCFSSRVERLRAMNLSQRLTHSVRCNQCEGA